LAFSFFLSPHHSLLIEIISSVQDVGIRVMQGHPAVGEGGVKGGINFHSSSRIPKVFPASGIVFVFPASKCFQHHLSTGSWDGTSKVNLSLVMMKASICHQIEEVWCVLFFCVSSFDDQNQRSDSFLDPGNVRTNCDSVLFNQGRPVERK
jgi:hypothetical protein